MISQANLQQLSSGNKLKILKMKFFGWRMVFTGLAVEFTVIGFLFYSFPVFWPYLISELGMTESQLGMITAVIIPS